VPAARIVLALSLLWSVHARAQGWFQFAVIGDAPYFAFEEPQVAATLDALGREPLAFVVHVGDMKNGNAPCSNELLDDRRALLDASPLPLVLTPGDNDWIDCDRPRAGAYDPLERLEYLRRTFFAAPESLGRTRIALERQPGRAENARWRHHGVLFVTLNMPGSENGARRPTERDARMADNFRWLASAAAEAADAGVLALVVIGHAEPGFGRGPAARDPYAAYRAALARTAIALGKPMLLIHGDDHRHVFDQPLPLPGSGRRIPNFRRASPYGSPAMAPMLVSVNPANPQLFEVRSGITPP
jgi:hypothetical protein